MLHDIPLIIYLANLIDGLRTIIMLVVAISLSAMICLIVAYFGFCIDNDPRSPLIRRWLVTTILTALISSILLVAIPKSSVIYAYAGVEAASQLSNSTAAGELKDIYIDLKAILDREAGKTSGTNSTMKE